MKVCSEHIFIFLVIHTPTGSHDRWPGASGPFALGVDIQPGWERASIVVAGLREDGKVGVEVYRDLLYSLRFPTLGNVLYLTACATVSLFIGVTAFRRLDGRLAEEL